MENPEIVKCLEIFSAMEVDEVLAIFREVYFVLARKVKNPKKSLDNFLDGYYMGLANENIPEDPNPVKRKVWWKTYNEKKKLLKVLSSQPSSDETFLFFGNVVGGYANFVPEPRIRRSPSFSGVHCLPNEAPIDDESRMSREMVKNTWGYFWLHTFLGD